MLKETIVHMGFDDIDTPFGGCTTHFVASILVKWVKDRRIKLIDYPNLIRLNPGVPWKTRGNGAVVLRFKVKNYDEAIKLLEEAYDEALEYLGKYHHPQHHPVIGMYIGGLSERIKWIGWKAVHDLIPLDLMHRVLEKEKNKIIYKLLRKDKKRGLIGVFSAIGYRMTNTDYTYELIAYRSEEYIDKPRQVNAESVKYMDKVFHNDTILNYDYETNRPLITPHGGDPVLLGIRGEYPDVLIKAYNMVKINEPVPIRLIYRTNQHTDAHLRRINNLGEAFIYRGVRVRVWVASIPKRIMGGHVIFKVTDGRRFIDVAAYEPTGKLRRIAEKLRPGDEVEVMGIVRPQSSKHGPTINLEKLHIIMVKPLIKLENPRCPRCGARMKSAGRGKGYKCPKCGYRDPNAKKIVRVIKRDLEPGWYEPSPRAFKHLMKPLKRFGKEKNHYPEEIEPSNFIWYNNMLLK
ncbi:tRNA(Ile)(2)-agmatinylcytidine synthase [Staphylothermus marinus]|uniref:tRNA(Ile)(2)-agmatinylcytidine synthase n=1 Tax=Staphylothermus marinus TaxID=2280 RepID=UPI000320BC87|nr:tRNA(Ile)(2)-agmatinylcytidine synthase [Staphylothermus marinus]